ncbi:hypothetical protein [Neptunomonas sp.]|uniref:hypothetical protein n=1 Tax=Neptunomonas sp. TaxID=1971898 RepID=UPI0025ED7781|nr:hypothetical protein [Neptunomonas sp.]
MEFSKTVKFDFPRIPVLGTLLLIIAVINYYDLIMPYLFDEDQKPSLGLITAAIFSFGTAGVSISHLISMVMFDFLFPIKKFVLKSQDQNYRTSYQWFESIQKNSTPNVRISNRGNEHSISNRLSIDKLSNKQVHATLHALEIQCRENSPAFGIQLEYYYSLYIFFFMSALFTLFMLLTGFYYAHASQVYAVPYVVIIVDCIIILICSIGTVRARKIKEHLRIILFNHDRVLVVSLLKKWFQCNI